MKQQITIYLRNDATLYEGAVKENTLRFENVSNIKVTDSELTFDYTSKSQGTEHSAVFFTYEILGYSTLKE